MPEKTIFVQDIQSGQQFESAFYVSAKTVREHKPPTPGQYLELTLVDKTGQITTRFFQVPETVAQSFEAGDVVWVRGRAEEYRGTLQLNIDQLRKCKPEEFPAELFLRSTDKDVEWLMARLLETASELSNPHLRQLALSILEDPEIAPRFKLAPAASRLHQCYLGGLLEHTWQVTGLCKLVSKTYLELLPDLPLDRDLLIAGAILHDVGKIREFSTEPGFPRTTEGELLGHISIGHEIVCQKMSEIADFPEKTKQLLSHLILSHHGALEWGSPKLPMTLEAIVLHQLENLDAQLNNFLLLTEEARREGREWSDKISLFDRRFYAGTESEGEPEASEQKEG